ncbi:hypothetical protein Vadar_028963 [Vaccinium darrowii]|uniref:Uncharacterized protein n=1 Tax=Vaccinium darrowii TaxID=229202 RepID=A0ACB7YI08_9ERIC|nr:hypothetical protein Vadar_028963 [Vaccinium darrowii]
MAVCNSKFLRLTIFLFLLFPLANSISFNFSSFNTNDQRIMYEGDATTASGVIQVTKNLQNTLLTGSVGRATYGSPIHLWDNKTGNLTDFNTHFSFIITATSSYIGDGLTFFLSPYNATIPIHSAGGYLGLFENSTAFNHTNNQIVAVEFDTFKNFWDPSTYHVGIDVNGIESVAYLNWSSSLANNETANAWVNYDSSTQTLSVYLTYEDDPVFQGSYNLSYVVDLREVLPEWVRVGFSGATGLSTEIHNIVSWTFSSTLGDSSNSTPGAPPPNSTPVAPPLNSTPAAPPPNSTPTGHKTNMRLMVGLAVGQASKESDVYSFGVVALEIACGRKPVEVNRDPGQVTIIEWVWSLYGKGQLFEAVDKDLTMEYDKHQLERLMLVGLRCCHPDHNLRPSIRQVINILTFEAPLPVLPPQMPRGCSISIFDPLTKLNSQNEKLGRDKKLLSITSPRMPGHLDTVRNPVALLKTMANPYRALLIPLRLCSTPRPLAVAFSIAALNS